MLEPGKRKLIACLCYTVGTFVSCGILVFLGKISGAEYVQGLDAAKYVVIGYLGVNAAGAAIQKFGGKP